MSFFFPRCNNYHRYYFTIYVSLYCNTLLSRVSSSTVCAFKFRPRELREEKDIRMGFPGFGEASWGCNESNGWFISSPMLYWRHHGGHKSPHSCATRRVTMHEGVSPAPQKSLPGSVAIGISHSCVCRLEIKHSACPNSFAIEWFKLPSVCRFF